MSGRWRGSSSVFDLWPSASSLLPSPGLGSQCWALWACLPCHFQAALPTASLVQAGCEPVLTHRHNVQANAVSAAESMGSLMTPAGLAELRAHSCHACLRAWGEAERCTLVQDSLADGEWSLLLLQGQSNNNCHLPHCGTRPLPVPRLLGNFPSLGFSYWTGKRSSQGCKWLNPNCWVCSHPQGIFL